MRIGIGIGLGLACRGGTPQTIMVNGQRYDLLLAPDGTPITDANGNQLYGKAA